MNRPPCRIDGKDCEMRRPGCQAICLRYWLYDAGRKRLRERRQDETRAAAAQYDSFYRHKPRKQK